MFCRSILVRKHNIFSFLFTLKNSMFINVKVTANLIKGIFMIICLYLDNVLGTCSCVGFAVRRRRLPDNCCNMRLQLSQRRVFN